MSALINDYRQRLAQKRREINALNNELIECRRNLRESISNPVTTSYAKETKENKGGRRKTRKRKGGFRQGQLVEIKWPNRDRSFNWWKARIIADNGGRRIIVHWIGLYTPDGFPLHEEIQRPSSSHVRIPSSGGTRTHKKRGGFQPWMDLTKDFVKKKFDLLVERGTKIQIKVGQLIGHETREEDVRNIILHKVEDEDGNIIDYKDTDGHYFFYRDPDVHYDTDYEREIIDLEDYIPGTTKINISKPQSGSGRKKRKTRKKKGGITPAEFNFQRFKAERFQASLNECREREKELQLALASASIGKQLPAELEKNVTSFMGGGRDLCEQGYGPNEDEFELLQRTIRKQIDEGELPEHLVELDGYGGLDMLMTINNVANDYCYRLKGRGAYCDQTTAKCTKQIQHRQTGGHHLYKRLGVSKYASQKQIRKAFKTLKKKRKATKKVKEAYKILSNKKTRKQYNNRYRKMKRK